DDVESGQIAETGPCAAAVTDKDIDDTIVQRRDNGIWTTGRSVREGATNDLLCLGVEDGKTSRSQRVGQPEHGPGIVTGRISLRCRGAEFDTWVKQLIEKISRGESHVWRGHGAQRIAREHRDGSGAPLLPQLQGVAHVCGGKKIDPLAPFNAL